MATKQNRPSQDANQADVAIRRLEKRAIAVFAGCDRIDPARSIRSHLRRYGPFDERGQKRRLAGADEREHAT
jgi:hypothetical protein